MSMSAEPCSKAEWFMFRTSWPTRNTPALTRRRSAVTVPLLREGNVVGVIFVTRTVPQPFTDKQIELVTTFADLAVISSSGCSMRSRLRRSRMHDARPVLHAAGSPRAPATGQTL
jgi:signal transduction protein with GAF and PtsI domain